MSTGAPAQAPLRSTIAFVSTRHDSTVGPAVDPQRGLLAAEIYLMNGDGTHTRRLTANAAYDGFPALSPDGSRIVFDSNRRRAEGEPFNTTDLFVMNADGSGQTFLIRGSSATWSADGKQIAFHASASGTGRPIKPDPGAATSDNDIFVLNVADARAKNITNSPAAIDDDPDWSPSGRTIVFTSHAATDDPMNSASAEIYAVNGDGTGAPVRLTNNAEEERGPAWSPDGKRIVYSCRRGGPDFEICIMNGDGTGQVQLTDNDVPDLTPSWSPDGRKIVFHRRVGGRGQFQLFVINADGTGEAQLTFPPGISAFPNWGEARDVAVGTFTMQTDVGRATGSASYDPRQQTYLIAGSGQNMWDTRDDFHFVWKQLTGNFILSTRARFIGKGVEAHRKIGWTIRPTLDPSGPHVTAAVHGDGLTSLQFRRQAGAITEEEKSADSLSDADAVIQLERRDGEYIMSVAQFGDTLVTTRLSGVSLPDTVYVGLFVCAHNDTVTERATFSNVRITTPAPQTLVPYRDYLGSSLEILDVATGNATVIHQYRGSFQAPNWTHDGKALIYVQEGRLYRFDLASRTPAAINTAFATRNNNDHVLSFDGRMMAISNHLVDDSGGASIVYTVPAGGGTPTRITAKGPSYLHGWSPDGRWLVYVGERNDSFDIYKIPANGGNEVRLTTAPGLDDGPEYTPDGAFIYFNSSRSGRMQIWRMRPDGSGQQQITNDGFNNWFPHISPDGKWIAYLAFGTDVAPDDHPFYKHVSLRLMPIGGGPFRVIAYLYGGQGTINVPSWSPDGKRLAFVSNSAPE